MKFEKGNNLGGRTVGSKNKITQKIRDSFSKLISDNLDGLQKDLDGLHPKDRIRAIIDLAVYVIPKMKAVEVKAEINNINNDFINELLAIDESNYEKLYKEKLDE